MRSVSFQEREYFFELVCSGLSFSAAAVGAGIGRDAAWRWWRSAGVMETRTLYGRRGGLAGSPPADDPAGSSPGRRVRQPLTRDDRAMIAAQTRCGLGVRAIAAALGRSPSVISRELARNRGADGLYWSALAHRKAHERRRRPKPFKLVGNDRLCTAITTWMDQGWSPGLIATMLRRQHPGTTAEARRSRVSHETIYRALYVQTRGSLRQDLHRKLSLKRASRRPRTGRARGSSLYREAFTISQRPPVVEDRAVAGFWEGDLIIGAGGRSAVGTLVERHTRFTILLHLPERHDADTVAAAMIAQMSALPRHLRQSLTWDRGSEMARYRQIQIALDMPVYFADPHAPWQRGTNENTNRLLRFWLEKGTDLSVHTRADLDHIAATLNARPRPTLDLQTPAQALNNLLANPQQPNVATTE